MADRKIQSLQVLRGFAALAVVFYHVYVIMMQVEYGARVVFQDVAKYGFMGVAFFFVLSGFIIFSAHIKDVGVPASIPRYLLKRFVRVYPAYWVYTTGFIAASAVGLGYPDFSWDPYNILSSYLLVPLVDNLTLPLKVAWTLVYEIQFYFIFTLLLLFGGRGYWLLSMWGALTLSALVLDAGWESAIFSAWNLYFLVGVFVFHCSRKISESRWWLFLLLTACFLSVFVLLTGDVAKISHLSSEHPKLHILLAVSFGLCVLGVVLFERKVHIRYPKSLVFIGEASYSIYLVHSAAISVMVMLGHKYGVIETLGAQLFFISIFILSVFIGGAAYLIIERPLINFFSKRLFYSSYANPKPSMSK